MGVVPSTSQGAVSTTPLTFLSPLSVTLLECALAKYREVFGGTPEVRAAAPGRVNLIGEHTDYNAGFVLPMALEQQTLFVGSANGTETVRLVSAQFGEMVTVDLRTALQPGRPAWANYALGVMAGFHKAGARLVGFDAAIVSDVPVGGGLSSSAALEVSTAMFLERLTGHTLTPEAMALLCQQAEHAFAGVPCGVMDQFISRCAHAGHALLLDCESLETQHILFADDSVSLLIINTMVKHALADGIYAQRRQTCEAVAKKLSISSLRHATLASVNAAGLEDEPLRRARHVVSEIARTQTAAQHLAAGNWDELGHLMSQSHASLRDDYEVSCAELDWLVAESARIPDAAAVYGARMTGGGFGGSMIVLASTDSVGRVQSQLVHAYEQWCGRHAESLISRPAGGASLL